MERVLTSSKLYAIIFLATNFIVWEYSSTVRMTVSKTEDAGSIPATPASSVLFNRACGSFKRARGPQ